MAGLQLSEGGVECLGALGKPLQQPDDLRHVEVGGVELLGHRVHRLGGDRAHVRDQLGPHLASERVLTGLACQVFDVLGEPVELGLELRESVGVERGSHAPTSSRTLPASDICASSGSSRPGSSMFQ